MFRLALLLTIVVAASAQEPTNLSLFSPGGIPTALGTHSNLQFSPQQAADDKFETGWVSADEYFPTWLRVEWRYPVTVHALAFRQWPETPVEGVGSVGVYRFEALRDGDWTALAGGDASGVAPTEFVRAELPRPVETQAVRLVIETGTAARVAVSELQVMAVPPPLPADVEPAWTARWIWGEPSLSIAHREAIHRFFRRAFTLDDPTQIKEAWLIAAAYDRFNAWFNATPLAAAQAHAGQSLRRPEIVPLPLDLLRAGENVLAVQVEDFYEVGSQGLAAELVLLDQAGERTVIATDTDWRVQATRGKLPDWLKPGYRDQSWPAATIKNAVPNRWQWLWTMPHPTVAAAERAAVVAVSTTPASPAAGTTAQVRISFETAAPLTHDHAVAVRLGERPSFVNHEFELWGGVAPAAELATSGWAPGRHEVTVAVPLPAEAPNPLPLTIQLTRPEGGVGLTTTIAGATADAYGVHLDLPLAGQPLRLTGGDFPKTEIKDHHGGPALFIDGQPVPAILWASSYHNYRRYKQYASSGIKIYRPLVDISPIAPPGEEDEYFAWLVGGLDQMFEQALATDPELKFVLELEMDPHPAWLFEQPAEQMVTGRGQMVIPLALGHPDVGQVRPTFMDSGWRDAGAAGLKRLVTALRAKPYAPSLIGVWLVAGRAGENYWGGGELNLFLNEQGEYDAKPREQWDAGDFSAAARQLFREWLKAKYGTDAALRAAWRQPAMTFDGILDPAVFRREEVTDQLTWASKPTGLGSLRDALQPGVGTMPIDYYQFMSEAMIDTFAAWGRAVKEASDNRLITGCYYGYAVPQLISAVPGFHGHTALEQACATPYLDGFSSPIDYARRRAGSEVQPFNVLGSLRLHHKLYVHEYDSRTFLAAIEPRTRSQRETLEVFKRDIAHAICTNTAWWWFEFSDQQRGARSREWFDDPEILALAAKSKGIYEQALAVPDRGPSSEIAVFYHPETLTAQDIFSPTIATNIPLSTQMLWTELPHLGAPHDLFILSDLPRLAASGKLAQYKLVIMLNPFYLTPAERQSLELVKSGGRTVVWMYAPGLSQRESGISAEQVAAVTEMPGVRLSAEPTLPTSRRAAMDHPLLAGLPAELELAPRAYHPQSMWARFGNEIQPAPYVDPAADPATRVLMNWLVDGQVQPNMGALAVRELDDWTSVYSPIPYLSRDLLRNLARFAGVHLWRESGEIVYATPWFVAVHTAAEPATGPLHLPRTTAVWDVFSGEKLADGGEEIELNVPAYSTGMYYLGERWPMLTP